MPKLDKAVVEARLATYARALNTFNTALETKKDNEKLYLDASAHRFMYCYEMTWKLLRRFLRARDIDVNSPVMTFREAFAENWIEDQKTFEQMITDRNIVTHEYFEDKAEEIYTRLPHYLQTMRKVHSTLEKLCQSEMI
ncbi:MAG: DUF86 domain-containing protein [Alphaproteobacteria bacterium]|nr:DUF86 domain-containing protein [Alphaproteobacteria bacterium]